MQRTVPGAGQAAAMALIPTVLVLASVVALRQRDRRTTSMGRTKSTLLQQQVWPMQRVYSPVVRVILLDQWSHAMPSLTHGAQQQG